MDAYTHFAQVYDLFMDNVPYEEWCGHLCRALRREGIEDGLVLDLGCGTGKLTRLMADRGYDMIAVDSSADMLGIAGEKSAGGTILYLKQDMRRFELYGTVRAIFSACDSMNYLLSPGDLLKVFCLVNNYLDPGGLFFFDMNTPYKYRELLGENTFAENREEGSFIWENFFDGETGINEYDLTLFIREGEECYRRFQEEHCQRCYEIEEVAGLLSDVGLELVGVFDGYSEAPLKEESERALFIAREHGKRHIEQPDIE